MPQATHGQPVPLHGPPRPGPSVPPGLGTGTAPPRGGWCVSGGRAVHPSRTGQAGRLTGGGRGRNRINRRTHVVRVHGGGGAGGGAGGLARRHHRKGRGRRRSALPSPEGAGRGEISRELRRRRGGAGPGCHGGRGERTPPRRPGRGNKAVVLKPERLWRAVRAANGAPSSALSLGGPARVLAEACLA